MADEMFITSIGSLTDSLAVRKWSLKRLYLDDRSYSFPSTIVTGGLRLRVSFRTRLASCTTYNALLELSRFRSMASIIFLLF